MKHLQNFEKLFEASSSLHEGGMFAFEDVINKFKQRYEECVKIANKYGFTIIKEMLDKHYTWKIIIILDNNRNIDDYYTDKSYQDFCHEIDDLIPLKCEYVDKRFLCDTLVNTFNIAKWERSAVLKKSNKVTGVFESAEVQKFVTIQIWLD